ncbi:MAG: VWA domain-containing protein [Acidobacteriota bacterium]
MSGFGLFFGDLWLLWILIPLYALWLGLWFGLPWLRRRVGRGSHAAIRYSSLGQVRRLPRPRKLWLRRGVQSLRFLTVALLMLAMVRPQTGKTFTEVNTEGIDIVLVMDTSGSMQALDLDAQERSIAKRRNRLEVAKTVVEDFVQARQNDQIGLVVFGDHAFTQCPLTLDHGILSTFLERVEIGVAGDQTAIGSAIGTAVKRLRDSQAESKVIILLTDGRNNAGSLSPATAAEIAQTFGIKIYAIGAGTRGKAPFLVETRMGPQVLYESVEIDEESLTEIAEASGGAYFRAEDDAALASIYAEIDELETTEISMESYMEYNERFQWFVFPAIALLLFEVALLGTRLRKLP